MDTPQCCSTQQSLVVAYKTIFQNCLVIMRLKTLLEDPDNSWHHSSPLQQVFHLDQALKGWYWGELNIAATSQKDSYPLAVKNNAPGMVSHTVDSWLVNMTSASFLGVTGHWMEVIYGKWKLHAEVIGFWWVSGNHSGENLRWYFMGVCEQVGIVNTQQSKVPLHMMILIIIWLPASSSQPHLTTCWISQQHARRLRLSTPMWHSTFCHVRCHLFLANIYSLVEGRLQWRDEPD